MLFKLFVSQYSIEFSAFSKAAVAVLILGKVIPLLDWAQSGYRFGTHRRAVVIGCKTFMYRLVVIALGIGEKIFHSVREAGSFQDGISHVIANSNLWVWRARSAGVMLAVFKPVTFAVELE